MVVTLDRPRDGDTHTLCDFAELLCLLTPDRICSREYLKDFVKDEGDKNIPDRDIDDCFSGLQWRTAAFGDYYPFIVAHNNQSFSAKEVFDEKALLYCFLLLSANLPFTRRPYNPITDAFERVAKMALEAMWPLSGTVRPFGKNETDYTGQKWERLNRLARDIGGDGRCNENTFRANDSGDGGIDLAAWQRLDDFEGRNIPSLLAQCACSRSDWSAKQTEISLDRLGNSIAPSHRWMQAIFVPHCFRDGRGNWAVSGDVGQTILVDRLRICRLLPGVRVADFDPPGVFNQFLEERLELV